MNKILDKVKNWNLFQNIFGDERDRHEQQENVRPGDGEGQSYSVGFSNIFRSRKRTATAAELFEPEITDDEDDLLGGISQSNKKARSEATAASEMPGPDRVMRSSGVPPTIEGMERQPWEFNFKSKLGPLLGKPNPPPAEPEPSTSKQPNKAGTSQSTFYFFKENQAFTKKTFPKKDNVEVITLEEDAEGSARQPVSPPSKKEMVLMKPRVSSVMKTRTRDDNRFTKALATIGNKVTGGIKRSMTYRLQERDKYKELLKMYNVMDSKGTYDTSNAPSALTKSKVDHAQLQVMYSRFGTSPTDGGIAFSASLGRKSILPPSRRSIGADLSLSQALVPKLFSTPYDFETPTTSSRAKALTFSREAEVPEVVDLETEKDLSKALVPASKELEMPSPITPVKRLQKLMSSPEKSSFSNLDEALNASGLAEPGTPRNEIDLEQSGLDDSTAKKDNEEEIEDLSIIAERIVDKSRKKTVNTLALEQSLSPYVTKRWLEDTQTPYRERQRLRDERIREEKETLNVLRRDSTLEKDLNQRIRDKLTLTEIIVLEEPPARLPDLTEDMMAIINHAKRRGNDNEVLGKVRLLKDTIDITRGDIKTLGPMQWLNDNVINTYLGLIVLRSKETDNFPNVYTFQTFFYPKLLKEGYSNSLKRWTRKDDIFAHDLIILPIHLGLHWCLACVDLRKKTIKYFDSMGGDNNKCLHSIYDYLSQEMKTRKQIDMVKSEWTLENVKGIPQQQNGSDCGMFACKFAEYLSRDAKFTFTQEHMPYFRDRMIYELIKQDLLHP